MRAGLDTSTVTPGITAPDVSCTAPEMLACAAADAGRSSANAQANPIAAPHRRISVLLTDCRLQPVRLAILAGRSAASRGNGVVTASSSVVQNVGSGGERVSLGGSGAF